MKQVCLVNGAIDVIDVPPPACDPGGIVVRTRYSLISTGTDLATTGGGRGRLGFVRQALSNPQMVRKVIDKAGTLGVRGTADLVRARLQSALPLGYSAAGEITEVGEGVTRFRVGDRVACGGAGYANHAEYVFVPENLVSLVPDRVSLRDAAFTTLGAIALHGVRRLRPTLGERVVVVGLGLIGQLAGQLLKANGCQVLGVDVRADRLEQAVQVAGIDVVGADEGLTAAVRAWTEGHGADGVILCASSGDVSLLNRSLELCRRKGRLVLVGDLPIRISRDRIYNKEIDFFISTSYGPGRYDKSYEERGLDYPLAYVRWTEGRNFAEVLRLIASGDLQVAPLVGGVVPVGQASEAYAALQSSASPIAMLLEYPGSEETPRRSVTVRLKTTAAARPGQVVLGVIGAGIFFRSVHQPNLARHGGFFIKRIATRSGAALRDTALRHGVPEIAVDPHEVLDDADVEAVLIATRHDRHAPLILEAIARGKHVFVEKPLALTVNDCAAIVRAVHERGTLLAVGFNRRFSPLAESLRSVAAGMRGPKSVLYRVNAGNLPPDHWLRDEQQGGGRLRGEGVHFFDFVRWLIGANVNHVAAVAARGSTGSDPDEASIVLGFDDGSVGTVVYTGLGSSDLPKERVEIFGAEQAAVLDDFRTLQFHGVPARASEGGRTVQKGHFEILSNFHDALRGKATLGVTAEDGYWATWCAEQALRSITSAAPGSSAHTKDA